MRVLSSFEIVAITYLVSGGSKRAWGDFRVAGANKGRSRSRNAEKHEGQWRGGSDMMMVIGRAGRRGPLTVEAADMGIAERRPLISGVSGSRAV